MCLFLCQYHAVLITMALYYSLISGSMILPTMCFFIKIAEAIQSFLWFLIDFWNIHFSSVEKDIGNFTEIALTLQIALGGMNMLMMLILPFQEHSVCFHLFVSSLVSFFSVL